MNPAWGDLADQIVIVAGACGWGLLAALVAVLAPLAAWAIGRAEVGTGPTPEQQADNAARAEYWRPLP